MRAHHHDQHHPTPLAGRRATRLAVALGSGSLHGHAHIGVIREFVRQGVKPGLVVGTSVGAIVGRFGPQA